MKNFRLCGSIAVSALVMIAANNVHAALDFTIHQDYTSTRALGMGNAFTALADDHSAMFYNPAALARREDGVIRAFMRGGMSQNWFDLVGDISDASDNAAPGDEATAVQEVLESNYGEHLYLRAPTLGGVWARPNWAVAFIPVDLSSDANIHQQLGPQLNLSAYLDTTIAYAYARDFDWLGEDHHLSVGVTAKALHRIYGSESVGLNQLVNSTSFFDQSKAAEGMTVDADVGFLLTPKIPDSGMFSFLKLAKPTFSFVIRNLLDYGFPMNFGVVGEDSDEPPKLQRRFDLGSVWDLPNFWIFDPHMTFDIRDMGHENWSLMKGMHLGAEFYWEMFKWWKGHWAAGLNQGYFTAGIGARLAWFQIDLATWGEEVGTSSAPNESRRYVLEMSLEF